MLAERKGSLYNGSMFFRPKRLLAAISAVLIFLSSAQAAGIKESLLTAAASASPQELKALLKKNEDYINSPLNDEKQTMLMAALEKDREYKVIETLIKYGADADKADKHKMTPTMYAARYSSSPETIERVIRTNTFFSFIRRSQTKRRILRKDRGGKCAYDYALENDNPDMVLAVLKKYAANPNSQPLKASKEPPTSKELAKAAVESSVATLSAASVPADTVPESSVIAAEADVPSSRETPVPANIEENTEADKEEPEALPQETQETAAEESLVPAIPAARPYEKTFLFDYAVTDTQEDETPQESVYDPDRVFIENANARDLNGRTKLMSAAKKGDLERIENLLYSGADINARDTDGWSALMFAARFCPDAEVVRELVRRGADTEQKNNYGISALKLASGFSQTPAIVSILLAPYSSTDSEARSSFIYAITSGASDQTLEVFASRGFSVNDAYNGKTPLMYAAETNTDTRIIGWLLRKGARTSYRTSSGYTAFDFAKLNKRLPHDSSYWALDTSRK